MFAILHKNIKSFGTGRRVARPFAGLCAAAVMLAGAIVAVPPPPTAEAADVAYIPGNIVGHNDVDKIEAYLTSNSSLATKIKEQKWLFTHASVGWDMVSGVNALNSSSNNAYGSLKVVYGATNQGYGGLDLATENGFNSFSGRDGSVVNNPGIYEINRSNPGDGNKITIFQKLLNAGWKDKINVAMNKFCWIDVTSSETQTSAEAKATNYLNSMQALENANPNIKFVYMTMPLSTDSNQNLRHHWFNSKVRAGTAGKLLLDIADIESHNGSTKSTVTVDNNTVETIVSSYTSDGGHLNNNSSNQRIAKAWYAMAAYIAAQPSVPVTSHTVTATAGDNGTINPSGAVTVNHRANQTFAFTPNPGYVVDQVKVDGVVTPVAGGAYTFTNVTANHTINVTFKVAVYTLTPTAGPNGTIAPGVSQVVNYGTDLQFTFVPDAGYQIDQVKVNGIEVATGVTTYYLTNVTENKTIHVTFKVNTQTPSTTHTINATAGANGTINPSGAVTVNHGANQTFAFTPNPGYVVDQVKVDGSVVTPVAGGTYTLSNVTANRTITVTFKPTPGTGDGNTTPPTGGGTPDNGGNTNPGGQSGAGNDPAGAGLIAPLAPGGAGNGQPVVLPAKFVPPAPANLPAAMQKPVDQGADAVIRAQDRQFTAAYISLLPEFVASTEAVIVAGSAPIDGTVAAPLATMRRAPVLYANADGLGPVLMARLKMGISKITLVGAARVTEAERQALAAAGIQIEVVQGKDRYETSEMVADLNTGAAQAFAADGTSIADSMAAAVAAGQTRGIVTLVNPRNVANQIAGRNLPMTAVGGIAAKAYPNAGTKLVGADRYDTANLLVKQYAKPGAPVFVTNGNALVDAVPASALAAMRGGVIVYTTPGQNTAGALANTKNFTGKALGAATYIGY